MYGPDTTGTTGTEGALTRMMNSDIYDNSVWRSRFFLTLDFYIIECYGYRYK
jgi:hypothetical protein